MIITSYLYNVISKTIYLLVFIILLSSCSSNYIVKNLSPELWSKKLDPIPETPVNPNLFKDSLRIDIALIPKGRYGRKNPKKLNPKFITIHSTQNPTGNAYDHARALIRGSLRGGMTGFLCWHFTVQEDAVVQHMPTTERGEHADFDGVGNRYSIGIEMCEHKGNDLLLTLDRTAKLTAYLMYLYKIPIKNIKMHHHWPREFYKEKHKNCPHFLLNNKVEGNKWKWFLERVSRHHMRLYMYDNINKNYR